MTLSHLIKYYWVLEHDTYPYHRERVFPTNEVQALFHYRYPFLNENENLNPSSQPQSLICGPVTSHQDILLTQPAGVIGVVFHPYAAKAFLSFPMHEIKNTTRSLPEISKAFYWLEQQIIEEKRTNSRIQLIEDLFIKRMKVSNISHFQIARESCEKIIHTKGLLSPKDLFAEFGMSERRFERIFRTEVGISPQRFISIAKFTSGISLMPSSLTLTDIACYAGYYDQAHFIRNFKRYMGMTPGTYRKKYVSPQ